jgi:hypothetical protein
MQFLVNSYLFDEPDHNLCKRMYKDRVELQYFQLSRFTIAWLN